MLKEGSMKNFPFNKTHHPMFWLSWVVIVLLIDTRVLPASEPKNDKISSPMEITADRMVTDNATNTAEFSGSVKATQGGTQITADRLILHYGQSNASAANDIDKIEAIGQVRILFDNRVAVSEQAVYTTSDRKLVLVGPNSKISEGTDEISGGQITFDRNSEKVTITKGNQDGQVKAIIRSDQRGLN
jgi:lipopolysaccharide export system protein LptA